MTRDDMIERERFDNWCASAAKFLTQNPWDLAFAAWQAATASSDAEISKLVEAANYFKNRAMLVINKVPVRDFDEAIAALDSALLAFTVKGEAR